MTTKKTILILLKVLLASAAAAASGFNGVWCLTSPEGKAVWLKVEGAPESVGGWLMWEIGGVDKLDAIRIEGESLVIERPSFRWYMTVKGMRRDKIGDDTLRAVLRGDAMTMTLERLQTDGTRLPLKTLAGRRAPPLPPAPDLAALKFGDPEPLFNGVNLEGWRLTDPADNNAWSVRDGMLVNAPELEEGPDARQFGNIRTDREFEDFRLQLELRLPKGGNSGIYLRGRYEVQVTDSYGREGLHGIGSVYSRIPALVNAAKPAGEWQRFDITLADRHLTVRLNDQLVIDNQPLEGCTGGALDSDDAKPGPIYFQGDHTAVEYRNILLSPRSDR